MTGVLEMMSPKHGDLKVMWDSDRPDEVTAARKQFDDMRRKGYVAFSVKKNGEAGDQLDAFDADAERIILMPQLRGGA